MHGYWRDKSRNLIQVPSRAVHGRRRPPLPLSLSRYRRRQWRRPSFDAWPKPPQRWDKELVWIYCERCTAEQAMDAKSWKRWFKFQAPRRSVRWCAKKREVEIKIKEAGLSFILSIPPSLYSIGLSRSSRHFYLLGSDQQTRQFLFQNFFFSKRGVEIERIEEIEIFLWVEILYV